MPCAQTCSTTSRLVSSLAISDGRTPTSCSSTPFCEDVSEPRPLAKLLPPGLWLPPVWPSPWCGAAEAWGASADDEANHSQDAAVPLHSNREAEGD